MPVLNNDYAHLEKGIRKGAYTVHECDGHPEIIFIATGSEVSLAMEAASLMTDKKIRVISMPCMEIFEQQSFEYKNSLMPKRGCLRVTIEAGIINGWEKYAGYNGLSIGLDRYGASAPGVELANEFGFTPRKIEERVRSHLKSLL